MSRIGKKPIPFPQSVTVTVTGNSIVVKGPLGELTRQVHPDLGVKVKDGEVIVEPMRRTKRTPALWGLWRALIANMIEGVIRGFEKKLEFEGIGFKANLDGNTLNLQLGFSHPVRIEAPSGIKFTVEKNVIIVSGINNEQVGNVAAAIRKAKPPEPYKGKGIRYQGEVIRRKAGKKAVAAA